MFSSLATRKEGEKKKNEAAPPRAERPGLCVAHFFSRELLGAFVAPGAAREDESAKGPCEAWR